MNRCVVFCSDAYTALGLIRSLGESKHIVDVISYGNCDYLLSSKYVNSGKKFKYREDALIYLIKDYPLYKEKSILFTIPDPPAYDVDCHLDEISKKFIVMNAGKVGGITQLMCKDYINSMAKDCGLNIPKTVIVKKNKSIPCFSEFPVFTKSVCSTTGGGKGDECICENQKELEEKAKSIKNDFLVTQYIKKKKEINYYGICRNGKVYVDYKDERTRFSNHAYGHYSHFSLCEKDSTYDSIISLMKMTKYEGIFDVEFLEDDFGTLYFLEVNFRTDGAIYRLCPGINLPDLWCSISLLPTSELPEYLPVKKRKFTGMTELSDFKISVLGGLVNPLTWFYQFVTADKHSVFNLRDMKPFIKFILNRF